MPDDGHRLCLSVCLSVCLFSRRAAITTRLWPCSCLESGRRTRPTRPLRLYGRKASQPPTAAAEVAAEEEEVAVVVVTFSRPAGAQARHNVGSAGSVVLYSARQVGGGGRTCVRARALMNLHARRGGSTIGILPEAILPCRWPIPMCPALLYSVLFVGNFFCITRPQESKAAPAYAGGF